MKLKFIFLMAGIMSLIGMNELSAQSAKEDFGKVFQKYAKVENLSLTMEAYSYQKDSDEGKLEFKGTFKKRGDDFYTKAWNREMVVNGEEMVAVNHDDQKIVIGKAKAASTEQLSFPEMSIDSLEAHGGKVVFVGKENGQRRYKITMPDAMIHVTDLYLTDSDIISRVVYHYQEFEDAEPAYARMDVKYKNVSFAVPDASFFNESSYVVKNKSGALKPSAKFAKYTVTEVDYSAYSNYGDTTN